jgi:ferredoxin
MIFYFSATGNSKYVAERIAGKTGDRLVSIGSAIKHDKMSYELAPGEDLGFVTPVYFWGIPEIVHTFLRTVFLTSGGGEHYIYHVATFGTVTGGVSAMMSNDLRAVIGLPLTACFAIRMVDTWTPIFDVSDEKKNREVLEKAEPEIREMIGKIKEKTAGDFNYYRGAWALFWPVAQAFYGPAKNPKHFSVTKDCISCGLCERQCPTGTIKLQDGHPVWSGNSCTLCLGCLHRCPKGAIRYGTKEKTVRHGQYVNPDTDLKDNNV